MSTSRVVKERPVEDEQLAGRRYAARVGAMIQSRYPQVADDYRANMGAPEIIDKYGLMEEFSFRNRRTAESAVHFALKGKA